MVVQNKTSLTGDEAKKILIRSATKSFDSKYIFAAVVFVFAIAILTSVRVVIKIRRIKGWES